MLIYKQLQWKLVFISIQNQQKNFLDVDFVAVLTKISSVFKWVDKAFYILKFFWLTVFIFETDNPSFKFIKRFIKAVHFLLFFTFLSSTFVNVSSGVEESMFLVVN